MADSARIVFDATVDEAGKLHPAQAAVARARLAKWNGKHVTVAVSRYVKSKTLPELGYYFAVFVPAFAEHCGDDEEEMHTELKRAYFPRRTVVARLTGEEQTEVPSLADATSEEMCEYLSRLKREAAHMGIYIPEPHEMAVGL